MEKTEFSKSSSSSAGEEEKWEDEFQELLLSLPKESHRNGTCHHLYQGFWYPSILVKPILSFQQHFHAHDTDLILASFPKSGTTWLKALAFTIVNRTRYPPKESPLLTTSPHELVPFLELDLYLKSQCPNLQDPPPPRIFGTHVPYTSLPASIADSSSKCRIVYVCRNPLDHFISCWQFLLKIPHEYGGVGTLDENFEMFCKGVPGPFWDHVLGFWKASLERPDKVLFFKYEDMKEDIISHTNKLADFLGFPFSEEERKQGVIEEISRLCSFESLKDLEANKNGKQASGAPNSSFFRNGTVGDWANYLTPSTAQRLQKVIEEKFSGSGLSFNMSCQVPKD